MANVTQSLFGFTPQDIQAQRDAEMQKQALQFAKLSPMESARVGLFQGVNQLGNAIGGALGYEDPEMAQARARQGLLGGLDIGDPNALRTAAANADPQTANLLIGRALELEKGIADVDAAKALADQRRREADPVQELAKTGKYTPASLAAYAKSRNVQDLVLNAPLTPTEIEQLQTYRDTVTDPVKKAEITEVIKGIAKGKGTTVTVNGKEEQGAFAKKLGEIQGNRMLAAYDKRDAASRELTTFEELAKLPDNQLISGSFADERVGVANFLNTIGLASKADADKVATSQRFEKLSGDLVLARVKQLGYNPSDADRKFIEKTIPSLNSSAAARKQLLEFMARVASNVAEEVSSMEAYATKNNTLTGYKPKIPQVSIGTPTKSVNSMTDQELLDALKNSKK